MNPMHSTRDEEVRALRAEVERLKTRVDIMRAFANIYGERLEQPRPLPDLQTYGYDVADVVAAIRRRGVHATETAWLADFIEALGDFNARAGD